MVSWGEDDYGKDKITADWLKSGAVFTQNNYGLPQKEIVVMRIRAVYPGKNYVLYVTFKENKILKFDMSDIIENDNDYFELKYRPELFIEAKPVNQRSIGWGDSISLEVEIIEKNGTPVNLGYLELMGNDFEELEKHSSEPVVKKALDNRYGNIIYFEDSDFVEFVEWLNGGFVSNLDEHDEPTDVALLYEMMEDGMTWLRESEKNWIDFLPPGADECMYSKNPNVEYMLRNDRFGDPQKMNENDTIWWLDDLDRIGPRLFTFDLKEVFNFWSDYPDALTPEQKAVFDKECPGVAELKKELR